MTKQDSMAACFLGRDPSPVGASWDYSDHTLLIRWSEWNSAVLTRLGGVVSTNPNGLHDGSESAPDLVPVQGGLVDVREKEWPALDLEALSGFSSAQPVARLGGAHFALDAGADAVKDGRSLSLASTRVLDAIALEFWSASAPVYTPW